MSVRILLDRRDGSVLQAVTVPLPDGNVLLSYLDTTDSTRVENALRERRTAIGGGAIELQRLRVVLRHARALGVGRAQIGLAVPAQRVLVHGTIDHGTQLLQPGSERIPTSYFGYSSGVTRAIRAVDRRGPIKLGILGLGAGVTANSRESNWALARL